jgi:sugar phosphate permease
VYPWLIALAGMLTLFMSNGLTATGLSVFDPSLLDEYGWARADLKFRDALTFWIAALLAPLVGTILDRINPKYLLIVGMACLTVGLLGYAALPADPEDALLALYAMHVLFALAIATAGGAVIIVLVSSWFVRHRGLALGIALVGTSLGSALLPALNAELIVGRGWREAFQVNAGLPLVMMILIALGVRGMPRHAGVTAVGQHDASADLRAHGLTFREALRTRTFYAIAVSGFLTYYAIFGFLQHLVLHLNRGLGYSLAEAARMFMLFSVLAMVAKAASGALADRIDRHRVFLASLGLMFLGLLALASHRKELLPIAVALIGLGWGGAFTLYSMLAVTNFGLREIGRINGTIVLCESIGVGLGSWVTGRLYDAHGDYGIAFASLAAMVGLGLVLGALVRREVPDALAGDECRAARQRY